MRIVLSLSRICGAQSLADVPESESTHESESESIGFEAINAHGSEYESDMRET
jgi:hypothetical protein